MYPWTLILENKDLAVNKQEDLLDLITALLKFNCFLSTTVAMQCTFQSSPSSFQKKKKTWLQVIWDHEWTEEKKMKKNLFIFPANLAHQKLRKLHYFQPSFFSPFRHIPPLGGFCKVSKLVCKPPYWWLPSAKCLFAQKLRPNLSEMEVRTFLRIQKVIWYQLLACKAEIIQK